MSFFKNIGVLIVVLSISVMTASAFGVEVTEPIFTDNLEKKAKSGAANTFQDNHGAFPCAFDSKSLPGTSNLKAFFEKNPLEFGVDDSGKNIAAVLAKTLFIKLSVYNDSDFLYIQAIIYPDNEKEGETTLENGYRIVDSSIVHFDLNADGLKTPNVDKKFYIKPSGVSRGLYYQTILSERSSTRLFQLESGSVDITYEPINGRIVRIDRYAIPLDELIGKDKSRAIKLLFEARSIEPKLQIVSAVNKKNRRDTQLKPFHYFHNYMIKR